MKLPDNLIKELISDYIGNDAVSLVLLINDKENVSELKIAEKLNVTVNEVRNILYRLNEKDLVSSTRKKDNKKGWYIYFWTFDAIKAKNLLTDYKKNRINQLSSSLSQEQNIVFFKCPKDHTRLSNEQALEYEFKCPECTTLLQQEDKTRRIDSIKNEMKRLENDLSELMKIVIEKQPKIKKKKIKEKKKITKRKEIKRIKHKKEKIKKQKPKMKSIVKIPQKVTKIPRPTKTQIIRPALSIIKKESLLKKFKSRLFKR